MCACVCINTDLLDDHVYGRILYLRFCLLKCMSMSFSSRCLYCAVSLTRVREWHLVRFIYYYLKNIIIVINVKQTQSSTHTTLMKNLRVQKHGMKLTQTSEHT